MAKGVTLRLTLKSEEAIQEVRNVMMRLKMLHKLLPLLGKILQKDMQKNFKTQGRGTWPPLSPFTIMEKQESGYPKTTLIRTRYMYRRATSGAWYSSGMGGGRFAAMLAVPGYSGFHFSGTRFMPRRDYSLISNDVDEEIESTTVAFLLS